MICLFFRLRKERLNTRYVVNICYTQGLNLISCTKHYFITSRFQHVLHVRVYDCHITYIFTHCHCLLLQLKLVAPSSSRFEHLVTQMKWRLQEGAGEAIYEIGVQDCGTFIGLKKNELHASMTTLKKMADRYVRGYPTVIV